MYIIVNKKELFDQINIPLAKVKITKSQNDKNETNYFIWDEFRNKKIKLTPEEWVRQHFLHYLVNQFNYPKGFIGVELSVNSNTIKRRADAVVFSEGGIPIMLIECKAPEVELTQTTFDQIARYNFKLQVDWLIMTNGKKVIVGYINEKEKSFSFVEEIPVYERLV